MKDLDIHLYDNVSPETNTPFKKIRVQTENTMKTTDLQSILLQNQIDLNSIEQYAVKQNGKWLILSKEETFESSEPQLDVYLKLGSSSQFAQLKALFDNLRANELVEMKKLKEKVTQLEKQIETGTAIAVPEQLSGKGVNRSLSQLFFGYMYSYPLIEKDEDNNPRKAQNLLSFQEEISRFHEMFTHYSVSAEFMLGTKKNFIRMITMRPKILHISCHGVVKKKNDEFFFYFENESKVLDEITCDILEGILEDYKEYLQDTVVFLGACHSSRAGEMFDAVCALVVCVHSKTAIHDTLALEFATEFYRYILEGSTVEEAIKSTSNITKRMDFNPACCCSHLHAPDCKKEKILRQLDKHSCCILSDPDCNCFSSNKSKHKLECEFLRKLEEAGAHINRMKSAAYVCCCDCSIPHTETEKINLVSFNETIRRQIVPQREHKINIQRECKYANNYFNLRLPQHFLEVVNGRHLYIHGLFMMLTIKKNLLLYGGGGIGKTMISEFLAYMLLENNFVTEVIKIENPSEDSDLISEFRKQVRNETIRSLEEAKFEDYLAQSKNFVLVDFGSTEKDKQVDITHKIASFCIKRKIQFLFTGRYTVASKIAFETSKVEAVSEDTVAEILVNKVGYLLPEALNNQDALKRTELVKEIDGIPKRINFAAIQLMQRKSVDEVTQLLRRPVSKFTLREAISMLSEFEKPSGGGKVTAEEIEEYTMLLLAVSQSPNGIKITKINQTIIGSIKPWLAKTAKAKLDCIKGKFVFCGQNSYFKLDRILIQKIDFINYEFKIKKEVAVNLLIYYADAARKIVIKDFNKENDFFSVNFAANISIWMSLRQDITVKKNSPLIYGKLSMIYPNIVKLLRKIMKDKDLNAIIEEPSSKEALETILICALLWAKANTPGKLNETVEYVNMVTDFWGETLKEAKLRNKLFSIYSDFERKVKDPLLLNEMASAVLNQSIQIGNELLTIEASTCLMIVSGKQVELAGTLMEGCSSLKIKKQALIRYILVYSWFALQNENIQDFSNILCLLEKTNVLLSEINIKLEPIPKTYKTIDRWFKLCHSKAYLYDSNPQKASESLATLVDSLGSNIADCQETMRTEIKNLKEAIEQVLSTDDTVYLMEFRSNAIGQVEADLNEEGSPVILRRTSGNVIHEKFIAGDTVQNIAQSSTKDIKYEFHNLTEESLNFFEKLRETSILVIKSLDYYDDELNFLILEDEACQPVIVSADCLFEKLKSLKIRLNLVVLCFFASRQFCSTFKDLGADFVIYFDFDVEYLNRATEYPKHSLSLVLSTTTTKLINQLLEGESVSESFFKAEQYFKMQVENYTSALALFLNVSADDIIEERTMKLDAKPGSSFTLTDHMGSVVNKSTELEFYGVEKVVGRVNTVSDCTHLMLNSHNVNLVSPPNMGLSTTAQSIYNQLSRSNLGREAKKLIIDFEQVESVVEMSELLEIKGFTKESAKKDRWFVIFNKIDQLEENLKTEFNLFFEAYFGNPARTNISLLVASKKPIEIPGIKIETISIDKLSMNESVNLIVSNVQSTKGKFNPENRPVRDYLFDCKEVSNCQGKPKELVRISKIVEKFGFEYLKKEDVNLKSLMQSKIRSRIEPGARSINFKASESRILKHKSKVLTTLAFVNKLSNSTLTGKKMKKRNLVEKTNKAIKAIKSSKGANSGSSIELVPTESRSSVNLSLKIEAASAIFGEELYGAKDEFEEKMRAEFLA